MNVTKHGETFQRIKCSFCGAELEFSEEDIYPKFLVFFEPPYVVCPECNRVTDVERRTRYSWINKCFEIKK